MKKKMAARVLLAGLAAVWMSAAAWPQAVDLASFEKRISVKKLANGMTVIVCRRPEAPVFSFFTFVDAGAAQDIDGASGLAHMMEHEAFKGTPNIGTRNWPAEKAALEKVERAYFAYRDERDKRVGRDPQKLQTLEKAWMDARQQADQYVIPNDFSKILDQNGQVGMNAGTAEDETVYFYSLPANRLELWAYMESERLLHPVMREFYKERDVVMEERRMRTDSQPAGRLIEQFTAAAYMAHPYHRPAVGWMSDLQHISATEAEAFFHKYYVPANMTVAVVGDVTPEQVFPLVERYFGRIPSGPKPEESETAEPPQNSERRVVLTEQTQPIYIEGYHRPDYLDPDDNVYDVLTDVLSAGRTSRLYRSLVRDQKIALQSGSFSGPGTKYPPLFQLYAVPNSGHTIEEMVSSIHKEIERVKNEDVTDDELKSVKTRVKAGLIRSLGSNDGLAENLALYQTRYGDWRELFRQVDKVDKVTKADIRRVANKIFTDTNRTVAILETKPAARPAAPKPADAGAPPAKPDSPAPPKGERQ
jgi:predicted Zn-dependent peptidase